MKKTIVSLKQQLVDSKHEKQRMIDEKQIVIDFMSDNISLLSSRRLIGLFFLNNIKS